MIAYIGKPFKLKFINNSNIDIELRGDIDVSKMILKFNKHQPYQPPMYQHLGGSKIRIFYNSVIPCHTVFELVFILLDQKDFGSISSVWNRITPFFRTIIKRMFFSLLVAALFGVAIYTDNKYNQGKIGDLFTPSVWIAEKLSDSEESIKSIDTRILTNNHKLYQSEGFLEAENVVNEKLNEKIKDLQDGGYMDEAEKLESELVKLKDEYWFLGNGLFVFKEVVTKGDKPVLVNFRIADDFCDMIGAQVISADDYEVMGGLLVYLSSIFSVSEDSNVPEWTRTETVESDYNIILMKSSNKTPVFSMNVRGEIAGDIEQTKAAFRCSMSESDFVGAE